MGEDWSGNRARIKENSQSLGMTLRYRIRVMPLKNTPIIYKGEDKNKMTDFTSSFFSSLLTPRNHLFQSTKALKLQRKHTHKQRLYALFYFRL